MAVWLGHKQDSTVFLRTNFFLLATISFTGSFFSNIDDVAGGTDTV